jgi:hypothetical protein
MRINDYTFIDPIGTESGDRFKALARGRPQAAERLRRAIEAFIKVDTELSCKVVESADVEIYLVPPHYVLHTVPDAAALMRVDHAARAIDIANILDEYGGYDETAQWTAVKEMALTAAESGR